MSNRHVHLTKEVYIQLFGNDVIEIDRILDQPTQFASKSFVTIKYKEKLRRIFLKHFKAIIFILTQCGITFLLIYNSNVAFSIKIIFIFLHMLYKQTSCI